MVNNIRNNTVKKRLKNIKRIKNAEIIKYKRHTPKQKELLNLFNDSLDTISTDKTLKSKCQKDKTLMSSKDENENDNDKTLMSSEDDENENKNENENDDNEAMN